MNLKQLRNKYEDNSDFNYEMLPDEIISKERIIKYKPNSIIVSRNEDLKYIYFIKSGEAFGQKEYSDGKEYKYFSVDNHCGNIGLLELLARKEKIIATIVSLTEVTVSIIDATIIYEYIMSDIISLRKCLSLLAKGFYVSSSQEGNYYYVDGINRLRLFLIDYYNMNAINNKVSINLTYYNIACCIGTSVRTVSRSLKKLRDNGEILSIKQKIHIENEQYERMQNQLFLDYELKGG